LAAHRRLDNRVSPNKLTEDQGVGGSIPPLGTSLIDDGERVSRKRVARLLQAEGLRGVSRRKWPRTTVRDQRHRPAPDLVERHFCAARANALWVADIRCQEAGVRPSMGSVGDCYDNAMCESFFATLECHSCLASKPEPALRGIGEENAHTVWAGRLTCPVGLTGAGLHRHAGSKARGARSSASVDITQKASTSSLIAQSLEEDTIAAVRSSNRCHPVLP
jgi:hypothetical protein